LNVRSFRGALEAAGIDDRGDGNGDPFRLWAFLSRLGVPAVEVEAAGIERVTQMFRYGVVRVRTRDPHGQGVIYPESGEPSADHDDRRRSA